MAIDLNRSMRSGRVRYEKRMSHLIRTTNRIVHRWKCRQFNTRWSMNKSRMYRCVLFNVCWHETINCSFQRRFEKNIWMEKRSSNISTKQDNSFFFCLCFLSIVPFLDSSNKTGGCRSNVVINNHPSSSDDINRTEHKRLVRERFSSFSSSSSFFFLRSARSCLSSFSFFRSYTSHHDSSKEEEE